MLKDDINDKVVEYLDYIERNLHLLNDYSKQLLLSIANEVEREW